MSLDDLPAPKEEDQLSFLHSKILHSLLELLDRLSSELVKIITASPPKKSGKEESRPSARDMEGSQRKDVQRRTIKLLFVLIAGICSRNIDTTKLLLGRIQCMCDNLPYNIGAIECFIQVFRDNRCFLKLLENEKISGKPCISAFLEKLRQVKRGNISLAINIAEFLRCLVLVNQNEALRLNQTIVGE